GDDAEEHGDEERDPQRDVPHPRDDEPDGGALRVLEDEHEEKGDEDQRADEAGADAPLLRRLAATGVEAGRHNRKRTRRSARWAGRGPGAAWWPGPAERGGREPGQGGRRGRGQGGGRGRGEIGRGPDRALDRVGHGSDWPLHLGGQ